MGVVSIIMAFIRRTTGWIVAAIAFSVLGAGGLLAGVVLAVRGFSQVIAQQSKPKAAVSDDGWVRLQVPGSWDTLSELHDEASLKVGNRLREEYAIVISERKAGTGSTLDDFAKVATDVVHKNLGASAKIGPIENVTAGAFAARRCRIEGTVDNLRAIYLHYSVETPEGFHQLIMWTLPEKEPVAWPAFERLARTFEVVTPPKSGGSNKKPQTLPHIARKGTVEERLRAVLVEVLGVPAEKVKPEARLKEDLGADELDFVELVMATEEEFDIEINDENAEKLATLTDFIKHVSARVK